eukprot:TRINITY_DN13651_c0_g1_i1.p1 TRINITY_DN13651_c0_g1~~TRINITY_DN13651_c0_g1_i1.p1  ORF type:complete len:549 (+),score=208.99 TRINITY_DN13651_c0_g1_i1:125-1771(+)
MTLPWSLVSVVGTEVKDGVQLYCIEVKPTNHSEPVFVLKKRYNMFRHLHKESRGICRGRRLSFPSKEVHTDIEKRRHDLDEWLAETVSMARQQEYAPLRTLLYEFLSERNVDPPIDLTPFHDATVQITGLRIPAFEERDGTTWYAVDIIPPQGEPVRLWKTYTMLKHLHSTTLFSACAFPGKSVTKLTSEKALSERCAALDAWFCELAEAARNSPVLMEKVRAFCIPSEDDDDDSPQSSPTGSPVPHFEFRIKAARLTGTEERGGTVYYKVEVTYMASPRTVALLPPHEDSSESNGASADTGSESNGRDLCRQSSPSQSEASDGENASSGCCPSASGTTTNYSLWKRYNMFHHLYDAVSPLDPCLACDFPGKSIKTGPNGDLSARRRMLDFWLAKLISAAQESRELQPHVLSFLDQAQRVTGVFDPRESPEIETVNVPTFEDRQGTIFYAIDVRLADGKQFRVTKSYSMFHELCSTCANLVLGSVAYNGFPPKHVNPIKKMTSDKAVLLKERHEALATWFKAMFERSHTSDYDMLKDAVREFLDSNHV